MKYGLSSSLYTKDVNRAFSAIRDLDAGITYINAPTIGAEVHLPFGGVKQTGNGHREGGIGSLDFYTEWKAVAQPFCARSLWKMPKPARSTVRSPRSGV